MKSPRQKTDILLRLERIEGQLRGLQRMVEEEVPCLEIMNQVAAATAAIKRVGMVMVQTYMEECLHKTQKEAGAKREENLRGLQTALSRYIDWA
jgi:DNA-binding FrmR family transcriptional regulator